MACYTSGVMTQEQNDLLEQTWKQTEKLANLQQQLSSLDVEERLEKVRQKMNVKKSTQPIVGSYNKTPPEHKEHLKEVRRELELIEKIEEAHKKIEQLNSIQLPKFMQFFLFLRRQKPNNTKAQISNVEVEEKPEQDIVQEQEKELTQRIANVRK